MPSRVRPTPIADLARRCGYAFLLACGTQNAFALDGDVLNVDLSASQRYETNFFSLPESVSPPGNGSRSGTTRQTGASLRIDKAYGQQQFDIYGSVTHLHYNPYDNLDFTSHTYGARWGWVLTPELGGSLAIDESRVPNSFSDTGFQTSPNPRTQQNKYADVNFRPGAALHPRLALIQTEDKSAQTTIERQNARTDSLEGALVYEFRSGNTAEAYFRRGRGRYFDLNLDPTGLDDSQFNEREVGVAAHYVSDGLSRFDARIGYLDRKHRDFMQRDFAGTIAQLAYTYTATGKTQIEISAFRSLTASQTAISSYSRDVGLTIRPTWAATAKISVKPSFSITNRDFLGSVTPNAEHLKFRTRDEALEVNWDALRAVNLSILVFHSSRTSNDPQFQYTNRGATINANLRF